MNKDKSFIAIVSFLSVMFIFLIYFLVAGSCMNHAKQKYNIIYWDSAFICANPLDWEVVFNENNIKLVDLSERACWLNTKQKVDKKVKLVIERMINDAEKGGLCLVVSSGYRSIEEQERIKEKYGDLAEEPGKSEHHTGLAIDFTSCPMIDGKRDDTAERLELKNPFKELPEYKWLKNNAHNYGFMQSYDNEPWHWKLVGKKERNEM